ncbi:G protein pathway suppressor 2 isoform X2 [Tribolium castaneum]|uniref:G protein pathway suppressor 2 isoform X2 n=1 Tax=Tribolium castaneum TaxID=7070 RepID=UPI00046C355B|nr:PREDICTED: G protein pathway suppressor 2 isoform X2 [Tribolium castaneum]|eukprot:XP_008200170.1 PREDICTED: G protein pathway suppressor 2 isoform X2 [Tribolium castaneum]
MPAAVDNSKPDRSEQMWKVLKAHILRERARKKQEREAEVEEERLRKEREAREQQDVMTLGETREQISQLESKLQKLKEEKHQLFLQLKKVLNEDDNRRRQKENNDVLAIQALPTGLVHHQPLYISPSVPRNAVPQQQTFKTAVKRPRSPSPQPAPVSSYHQGYGYKPSVAVSSYQNSPQKTQYPSQQATFYSVSPQDISMYYPLGSISSREPPPSRSAYEPPRPQTYHLEQKLPEHYTLRVPSSHGHVIHGGSIPLSPAQPKTGSITAGYPVRSQQQYQQSAPASLYTAQSRPLYQSPGTPMNYPPRE